MSKAVTESNKNRSNNQTSVVRLDNAEINETKVQKEIAKIADVSADTVGRYDAVIKYGDEELKKNLPYL